MIRGGESNQHSMEIRVMMKFCTDFACNSRAVCDERMLSNRMSTMEEHVEGGLASAAWVEEKVWGFVLGRGDLVLPQLAPVHVPREAHGVWRARHERTDKAGMSTALRRDPDAQAPQVQVPASGRTPARPLKVAPKEKVSVLQMHSEILGADLSTWVKVAVAAGEGWLKREHLRDVDGFAPLPVAASLPLKAEELPLEVGREARHERADKPAFLSQLRETPSAKARQVEGVRAEAGEQVTVLGLETVTEGGQQLCWVKVATASGAGWLKRQHLQRDRPAKRQRKGEVWHCRINPAAVVDVPELQELLQAYGVVVRRHQAPEAWLEGPRAAIAAIRAGKLLLKVSNALVEFIDASGDDGARTAQEDVKGNTLEAAAT
eukprot:TRINITY_DN19107_c0_g1_i1.p1 TRINITY_DN19107_c0_g1~~TRINITY_DN19107_c0_g1_i1.p1  ORF type:complete len:376 (+),score=71.56 TRINITY_DN19107_c0_g1_i1:38-1165(+)